MTKEKFTEEELHFKFVNICKDGDLTNFRKFYNEYYLKNRSVFSSFLKIFSKKPALHLDEPDSKDSQILLMSAMVGQHEVVKELLKDQKYVDIINKNGILGKSLGGILSPQRLTIKPVEYDVFKNINNLMYDALKDKTEFHLTLSTYFMTSCNNGDISALKYMNETPSFKEHLDFDMKNMPPGFELVKISSIEALNYLIIECDMEQNKAFFDKILRSNDVLSIIEKKNLNYELRDNLDVNVQPSISKRKPKI